MRLGYPIQLTHAQLIGADHWISVHPQTHKKMTKSHANKKGVRIQLTPQELEASGEGLKEFWDKVKAGGKWVKEKVIDTPFYQKNVRPIARSLVNTGQQLITGRLGPVAPAVNAAIDEFGRRSGAYGLCSGCGRRRLARQSGGSFKPA